MSLSSSLRDEDNNSEFDRFESSLTKADEALYIQNCCICRDTMKRIETMYGPFDQDEIDFYMEELSNDDKIIINGFQKELIFNLFYKYFGDPVSIRAINAEDYVKLIIAAKKMLDSAGMVILPYIISSKISTVPRKTVNKKELTKIKNSQYFKFITEKYNNEKIIKQILSIVATILSSKFTIISYDDDELNGKVIDMIPEYICEEVLLYITMI